MYVYKKLLILEYLSDLTLFLIKLRSILILKVIVYLHIIQNSIKVKR